MKKLNNKILCKYFKKKNIKEKILKMMKMILIYNIVKIKSKILKSNNIFLIE